MSLSFQRKDCELCKKKNAFHRKPDAAPCLLCTYCQKAELKHYDDQAMRDRMMMEILRDSVKPFPAWERVSVGRN